jgi:hypothetical protein
MENYSGGALTLRWCPKKMYLSVYSSEVAAWSNVAVCETSRTGYGKQLLQDDLPAETTATGYCKCSCMCSHTLFVAQYRTSGTSRVRPQHARWSINERERAWVGGNLGRTPRFQLWKKCYNSQTKKTKLNSDYIIKFISINTSKQDLMDIFR